MLEELRRLPRTAPLLFTSTNKVYGSLPDVELERVDDRWEPVDATLRELGIDEERPLHFCTPYGCSKGGADQYVLDYARRYGLPAVVFRMSCIYGPHQHGTEEQGWLAHFILRALADEPLTIYGDGAQVRDVLYVTDLVDAMLAATAEAERFAGTRLQPRRWRGEHDQPARAPRPARAAGLRPLPRRLRAGAARRPALVRR